MLENGYVYFNRQQMNNFPNAKGLIIGFFLNQISKMPTTYMVHPTGAATATNIIATAGLGETAAGSIVMGLGGYLAACTYGVLLAA